MDAGKNLREIREKISRSWYTAIMPFASPLIVAAMLLDFMQPLHTAPPVLSDTAYADYGTGNLQVSVSSAALQGSTPRGATRVQMAELNISASCDADITIDTIMLKHTGLGEVSDITGVYLHEGFRRVSRARTFDRRSQQAELRLPSFVVHKCEAVRVKVLVDISSTATVASEHSVTVENALSIVSSAKTTTLLHEDTTERMITSPKQDGSIRVNFLPISGPLRFGRIETVARIQLTADTNNDQLLRSITFTNLGDARDMNLLNFVLVSRRGDVLSPVAQRMRGLRVTLDVDPTYILERGKTVVLLLKAQINGSQSKTVNFTLEEPSDLHATVYRPSR